MRANRLFVLLVLLPLSASAASEDAQANRIASGAMEEIMQDIPLEQRAAFVSIGRDLLVLARREQARASGQPPLQGLPQSDPSRNLPPAR